MPEIALALEPRTERGSAASRRLRAAGRVPGVVYGHGDDPLAVTVDARVLRAALNATRGAMLFDLEIGGERHLAIAREIQRHPVRHTVAHVDFQVVSRDEVVAADIPIVLLGEALGVTRPGGTVDQALVHLHVRGKPADIPDSVELDISDLEIGVALRVSDLTLPADVTTDLDPETPVVVGQPPRAALEEVEAAEGEAAEGAEGAPAAESAGGSGDSSDAGEAAEES